MLDVLTHVNGFHAVVITGALFTHLLAPRPTKETPSC